ncbi:MAG: hypothetical protein K9N09_11975 [Candidatus Cloacimonetes bacterium]|nr:hypothetical protein [Candidatus Cloacimonadota bacterium]MCF7815243.1 hypothetical protein [Candidatus Cloacimonadota bacterium]MCF7869401.1 hypothetical protein [Candidatus Cloacimonadota bacterium]MCF7884798.1 hypothetical protein [Candidatus Cloacimonadota bacterium]
MKVVTCIIMVNCVFAILFADADEGMEKYQTYNENQTTENLIEVINHFSQDSDDEYHSAMILGNVYLNQLEKQLEVFESNLDSLSYGNLFGYANLLLAAKRYDESIEIYNKINAAAPNWSCPWRHKGEAYLEIANYEKAEEATQKAIETREDHFDAYIQLAKAQKALGKYEEALKSLEDGMKYQESDHEGEVSDNEIIKLRSELVELLKK